MATATTQACERCWKRKQKCDRRHPCSLCTVAGAVCIERRLGTVEDPSDPTRPLSYIESLKARVRLLERRQSQSAIAGPPPAAAAVRDSISVAPDAPAAAAPPSTVGAGDHLQTEMGYLPLSAMAEFSGEQGAGVAQQLSSDTLFRAAIGVAGTDPTHSLAVNPALGGPMGDYHKWLLSQRLSFGSMDTGRPFHRFLDMAQFLFPLFDRDAMSASYTAVLHSHEASEAERMAAEAPDQLVSVYAAVANGLLMSENYIYTESFATVLALHAFQLMPTVLARSAELDVIRCLFMLAMLSMYTAVGGSAWHLLGFAISRCISAGLHTARVSDFRSQDKARRESSRVFWNIYMMDAMLSCYFGRPFLLHDEDITTLAPLKPDLLAAPALLDWHPYNVHFARLLHDIQKNPSAGILFHFSNFRHWKETVPLEAIADEHQRRLAEYQHYRASAMVLVQILSIPIIRHGGSGLSMATNNAQDEFSKFLSLLEHQAQAQDCVLTPFDIILVFQVGVQLISIASLEQAHHAPASIVIQPCLRLLLMSVGRVPLARRLHDILDSFAGLVNSHHAATEAAWRDLAERMSDIALLPRLPTVVQQHLSP